MRGATRSRGIRGVARHISIHAPHARSDFVVSDVRRWMRISIHAPHARSDLRFAGTLITNYHFNPRSSCEERRILFGHHGDHKKFQSTLLMRGATWQSLQTAQSKIFQSTLLMRGATQQHGATAEGRRISIHAPHARSDIFGSILIILSTNFNPRSSCEERPIGAAKASPAIKFQSTLLMRGATINLLKEVQQLSISIHAPHARSDLRDAVKMVIADAISIHAPHARSDDRGAERSRNRNISIHAPHARSDGVNLY